MNKIKQLRLTTDIATNPPTSKSIKSNMLYSAYKYSWAGSLDKGLGSAACEVPRPSPKISCSGGQAEITDVRGVTCMTNNGDISCDPQAEGSIAFRCIGNVPADLQAITSIPSSSTLCGCFCHDHIYTTCGTAKQRAVLETLCDDKENPVKTVVQWVLFRVYNDRGHTSSSRNWYLFLVGMLLTLVCVVQPPQLRRSTNCENCWCALQYPPPPGPRSNLELVHTCFGIYSPRAIQWCINQLLNHSTS